MFDAVAVERSGATGMAGAAGWVTGLAEVDPSAAMAGAVVVGSGITGAAKVAGFVTGSAAVGSVGLLTGVAGGVGTEGLTRLF